MNDTLICLKCNEPVIKVFMKEHIKVCNGLINRVDAVAEEVNMRDQLYDVILKD